MLQRISYKNVSGIDVPPHGIVQVTGEPVLAENGIDIVLQVTKPGSGTGPFMVDAGGGAKATGDGQYGACFRGIDGLCWVAYGCGSGPPTPWCDVGPVANEFYVNEHGIGYTYAGLYEADNDRILVLMDTFNPELTNCSSSSSSGSNGSSSGSSSSSSNCVTVVTEVTCDGNGLHVTYGSARKC